MKMRDLPLICVHIRAVNLAKHNRIRTNDFLSNQFAKGYQ
jgi:hypothetical protein